MGESTVQEYMDKGKAASEQKEDDATQPIMERLSALERHLKQKWDLLRVNQRLDQELREKDRELAAKDIEIERLQRELVYQRRLCEKEIEDQKKLIEEKWALMEREASERIAREREYFEEKLALEEKHWAEKISREQEHYARKLAEAKDRESLWSRLVKMMTWS